MKKIFLTIAVLAGTFYLSAAELKEPSPSLSQQIHTLLEKNRFELKDEVHAQVRFTLNDQGEIVVLSVRTENSRMEGFIKGKLNYQKVQVSDFSEGKVYTVPVKMVVA